MNIKLLAVLTILSLFLIFGFEKISHSLSKENHENISELKILTYLPTDNKALFISNSKISKITNNISNHYEAREQDQFVLIKDSIFAYLGIDLGINNLKDIYSNEFALTTYDNKEKDFDDILIIFKIKEKKDIDDILNLSNKIDEPDKLIKIYRDNKLNYLKYIYRTNDNYIITSSNENLILKALESSKIDKNIIRKYSFKEVLNNYKNEQNILLTNNFKQTELLNNENYNITKDDYLVTLFKFKDKEIILKSYLVNNNKNLDFQSYKKINKENIVKRNYQISTYNSLFDSNKYLNQIKISDFEKDIFRELNKELKQNILLLITDNNWLIILDKNNFSFEKLKLLEDLNKNSLTNNNNVYTIYSKDILKKEKDIIKESNYKKIFLIQSENLTFIGNNLVNEAEIDLISKEFFNFRGDSQAKYFLNKKIDLNHPYSIQAKNISYLEKINFFFKNVTNVSSQKFTEIIKQPIPETTPLYYEEINLKIF
ncbi:Conserved hypothetical protein [Prochlorococcus marinus str. MIT 9515]|uniref:DUF3352 domain-containing protein n=1 Tax=Prochlorococcus marinus (strain MIT 9515) TaxID=167542 RepID=A2BUD9_PROM5|nr:hypothetical protein [Prochlorococcus marinus]ABM71400.1 Conserved hypothetical protein [Prochlorococcus marinus str. MIT 9515]